METQNTTNEASLEWENHILHRVLLSEMMLLHIGPHSKLQVVSAANLLKVLLIPEFPRIKCH